MIISRSKCTFQKVKWINNDVVFPVPIWLFGPCMTALCVADWSPENVKLSTTVSVKSPVRLFYLVYVCQQGTLVERTKAESSNCLRCGISCGGYLFLDVFLLITRNGKCMRGILLIKCIHRIPVVYMQQRYNTLSRYMHDVFQTSSHLLHAQNLAAELFMH